jgi:probable HAF family extracellular repeat protein
MTTRVRPISKILDARRQIVENALQGWMRKLIDLSRRNNLLYFRPLKRGDARFDFGKVRCPVALFSKVSKLFQEDEGISCKTSPIISDGEIRTAAICNTHLASWRHPTPARGGTRSWPKKSIYPKRRNTMKRIAFALALAILSCGSMLAQSPSLTFSFEDYRSPGHQFTQLLGVNNAGVIAGYRGATVNKGFTLVLPDDLTQENYPKSAQTQVIGINNSNDSDGFYIDTTGVVHGFVDIGGNFSTVDFPGTTSNTLNSLNDNLQAAGFYNDAQGNSHPYIYSMNGGGVFEELFLPGTTNAQATGINNEGTIVGFYADSNGVNHGWELKSGTYSLLNFPKSTSTQPFGINNKGAIVGTYTDSSNLSHGFEHAGGTWTSIDDPHGIGITLVTGINDKGVIVGFYTISTTINTGFIGTPE